MKIADSGSGPLRQHRWSINRRSTAGLFIGSLLLLCSFSAANAQESAPPALTFDAIAEAPGVAASRAQSGPQPNKTIAAMAALQRCSEQLARAEQRCELLRVGRHELQTARQLRAAAASKQRKLFLWEFRSNSATVYLGG